MAAPLTMCSLPALPAELIIKILDNLDLKSMLACRQVCHLFRAIMSDTVALQYKIELVVAGMEDGPPSGVSTKERLIILQKRQNAWNNVHWKSSQSMSMSKGEVWELYGGVLAQALSPRGLSFRQLPSAIRGIPERDWIIEDVGLVIRDFGMDPSQDLLVIIEIPTVNSTPSVIKSHLRKLSTGEPHPAAPNPAVLAHSLEHNSTSYTIQICGDHLGVMFLSSAEEDHELLVWNWKTGAREMCIYGVEIASFGFLTERHVLVGVLPSTPDDAETSLEPTLMVIDFKAISSDRTIITEVDFICDLHYPTLSPLATPLAISVRCDPAPTWTPHPDLKVPFHIARQDRLFVVTFWIADTIDVRSLLLFVPSITIMAQVESLAPGEIKRSVQWDEWGPTGTRMIRAPAGHPSVWVCYVYGMTFVAPWRANTGPRKPKAIQTFDFNQLAFRRTLAEKSYTDDEVAEFITETTSLSQGMMFRNAITTSLPYRQRTIPCPRYEDGEFSAVMLSEDSLLMVYAKPQTRRYRILTF